MPCTGTPRIRNARPGLGVCSRGICSGPLLREATSLLDEPTGGGGHFAILPLVSSHEFLGGGCLGFDWRPVR
jgi:hypothetical protein